MMIKVKKAPVYVSDKVVAVICLQFSWIYFPDISGGTYRIERSGTVFKGLDTWEKLVRIARNEHHDYTLVYEGDRVKLSF